MSFVDVFLSQQLLFATLVTGALYAIIALGLNLVYGTMRLLNVAHGELVMVGAYVGYWLFSTFGLSPLLSTVVVAAFSAIVGVLLYKFLLRDMLVRVDRRERLEANSLLLFFGLSLLIQNVVAWVETATPRAYQYMDQVYRFGDLAMTGNRVIALLVALAICIGVTLFLRWSVFGLALRSVIEQPEAARIVGVNVEQVHIVSLTLGFASAGVAGVLLGMMEQFSPFIGFPLAIAAFIVVILGGLGNILGGFLAALLLGAIETYGVALTSPNLRSVLLYGVFVATLMFLPQGLFAKKVSR
ncbi:MAG: hypothetical protein CML16_13040 [Pusillimonas sp.]|nr:hypothetical protein [Pusillimonas sp.]MBC41531.1 hypothetical protein [Pusillimonas sp.]HCP76975.1 hypothetical protein [Pusillimonas sp.]|tara:strand:+ start:15922 stop:16818 length:897 start_codon:yes stop_codon:yes gene_type:complete